MALAERNSRTSDRRIPFEALLLEPANCDCAGPTRTRTRLLEHALVSQPRDIIFRVLLTHLCEHP